MTVIDSHELHLETISILRRVRERGETIEIAHRGQVIAYLTPVEPARSSPCSGYTATAERTGEDELDTAPRTDEVLDRLWSLGDEISKAWPKGVSAVDAIRDVRRDT